MAAPPPLLDNGVTVLRECRHGPLCYFKHDRYIGHSLDLYGEFSERELDLFLTIVREGDLVVDAGANIGALTVPLARRVGIAGRVLAFEPQRAVHQLLCANIALNGLTQVDARHAALGDVPGTIAVPVPDYARRGNFGGISLRMTKSRVTEDAPIVRLDDTIPPDGLVRFVKVDVEGMELEVLRGAAGVIREHRPYLVLENDRPDKSKALIEHLFACDYRVFWFLPPLFSARNFYGNAENVFGKLISINLFAVPAATRIETTLIEITDSDAWIGRHRRIAPDGAA